MQSPFPKGEDCCKITKEVRVWKGELGIFKKNPV
jgi:hypothetical protein